MRADGVVTIVDRLKELIKYKGYQIAPAELEALLLTHPGIADAAVVGSPRRRRPGGAEGVRGPPARRGRRCLGRGAVMDFVAARVAPLKKVRQVEFIEAVPKSASGKILRRMLGSAGSDTGQAGVPAAAPKKQ